MSFRLRIDDSVTADHVVCWGVTVALLKKSLFGSTPEERKRRVEEKISQAVVELGLEGLSDEFRVSMLSAWVRYYVFRVDAGEKTFVLNVLSPNSPVKSFRDILDPLRGLFEKFRENIAVPVAYTDEFMLQEWINGLPLSELRDGDVMRSDEKSRRIIEESIYLTARLLYRLWKEGFVYSPWEDYEAMYCDGKIVLLDVTRFEKKPSNESFLQHYYGAPFCPPDVLKDPKSPVNRLYFRGTSERDYFGVEREKYEELFLKGIRDECGSEQEFKILLGDCEAVERIKRV
ncbi:hypothetical protein [Archaeoglobus fulgidus]|jgi:hypothetical protein|uniref:Uncharacterized protein AF_2292 n=2 Tax=Archaeoglobus fulgidus TaxID=2234 RepID=Y2292_ARCFU|nr:hypothetical protein [Archaeoglobus fulgidus]O27992.1 RecName: Full=Uncharacterized protein AF_2292 [Archaeoglobus fulgidus DSM 4304]AAB88967.1 predicted coding region AF_2292 [Archaeoglobus fulgidus DSM 4304]AIG99301.1 hypothetical protein AFULGI_00025910 [Archaeoglobus fulgidus DSM 8774]